MAVISDSVFSEFELTKLNVIFSNGDTGTIECISKFEEEMETKTTVKKCRGVEVKSVVRGTGKGKGKVTAHMPFALYNKLHDMEQASLTSGVKGYGYNAVHPQVCVTADVYNDEGDEKYKAYPVAVITTGPTRTVENGADEVAECELEFTFAPDTYGFGMYEAEVDDLSTSIKNSWLLGFSGSLVTATEMSVDKTLLTVAKGGNGTVTLSNKVGTPTVYVKQVGAGVTATLSSNTLTIAASSSATAGTAWVEIIDGAGATATITVTVSA